MSSNGAEPTETTCGPLTVLPAFDPSLVRTDGCVGLPGELPAGATASVDVTVVNDNPAVDAKDVAVSVFMPVQELGRKTGVAVPAGTTVTVSVPITAPAEGTYSVDARIESAAEATAAVASPTTVGGVDRGTAITALGGAGITAALIALR